MHMFIYNNYDIYDIYANKIINDVCLHNYTVNLYNSYDACLCGRTIIVCLC